MIYLTSDWKQAARIVPGDYPNEPTGITYQGRVILNDAEWRYWGDPGAQGVIVHELTHLVTEHSLAAAPTSLAEGLAQYEQDRYLHRHNSRIPLTAIGRAYRHGFPTAERWRSAVVEWGLHSPMAIELSYDDAEAMVRTVLVRHGGMAALRRLAKGFAGRQWFTGYSLDTVRSVFRTALGVPLRQVEREAHAWVWSDGLDRPRRARALDQTPRSGIVIPGTPPRTPIPRAGRTDPVCVESGTLIGFSVAPLVRIRPSDFPF